MEALGQRLERHKQLVRSGVVVLLAILFFLYGAVKLHSVGYPSPTGQLIIGIFLTAGVLGIGFIVLLHWLSWFRRFSLERLFLISMIVLSLAYMLLFPPVTVPDEQAHYISAYRMSNFFLFHWGQWGNPDVLMRAADFNFFDQFDSNGYVSGETYRLLADNFSLFADSTEQVIYSADAVTNVPLGYLASALGIALGRLFHLGGVPVFYLGRMFNMAQYIVLACFAMRRIPFGKAALFIISMFPMTLHLCASYSYDCMIIGVSMLFVAEVVRMICGDSVRRGQLILCAVYCFVLAPSKLVYTPLLFLVLLIPGAKLKGVFRRPALLKVIWIAAGIAGLLIGQLGSLASYVDEDAGSYIAWAGEPGYSLNWVLHNIAKTVLIFLNTLIGQTDYYFNTMLGGQLGWFQLHIPGYFYLLFALLFFLACLKKRQETDRLGFVAKCWVLILVLGSCALVLASMFLSWTPMTSDTILGVQGRYFLPLLPAVFLLLRSDAIQVTEGIDRHIVFLGGALNVFVLAYCFLLIFAHI